MKLCHFFFFFIIIMFFFTASMMWCCVYICYFLEKYCFFLCVEYLRMKKVSKCCTRAAIHNFHSMFCTKYIFLYIEYLLKFVLFVVCILKHAFYPFDIVSLLIVFRMWGTKKIKTINERNDWMNEKMKKMRKKQSI